MSPALDESAYETPTPIASPSPLPLASEHLPPPPPIAQVPVVPPVYDYYASHQYDPYAHPEQAMMAYNGQWPPTAPSAPPAEGYDMAPPAGTNGTAYPATAVPLSAVLGAPNSMYSSIPQPNFISVAQFPGPAMGQVPVPEPEPELETSVVVRRREVRVVPPPPPPVFDREHQAVPGTYPSFGPGRTKGSGFKRVIVFEGVLRSFMKVAERNNRMDIETCGLLCCRVEDDALVLDTCLVPHQKGSRDTCSTLNEEEQFDFLDKRQLILAGWIHTHPTQPCFLSSVDLHTQFGYQCMLAEAIAIVVAPRSSPNYGIFTLSPDGISVLKNCDLGGFHSHPMRAMYVPNPRHVVMVPGEVNIVDQRR